MSSKLPRHVLRIPQYEPGMPEEDLASGEGGGRPLKLASNENPLGPSPLAVEAARGALEQIHRYPDGSGRLLREALAARWSFPAEQIVLGNGSTELVELLARAFLGGTAGAVIAKQSFIMYRIAVLAAKGRCLEVALRDMRYDLPRMARECDRGTALVYIANPNNPTGTYVSAAEMEEYFRTVPASVLTVLDEAYGEYVEAADYPSGLDFLRQGRNLVVLRTFSKAYGLAGLRLGYALASREVVATLERLRSPFNTSRIAQSAGVAALQDVEHLSRSRASNRAGLHMLQAELGRRGIRHVSSVANFLLVDFERPGEDVYRGLLKHGVITRPMAAYGFPQAVRITVGAEAENARLLAALDHLAADS